MKTLSFVGLLSFLLTQPLSANCVFENEIILEESDSNMHYDFVEFIYNSKTNEWFTPALPQDKPAYKSQFDINFEIEKLPLKQASITVPKEVEKQIQALAEGRIVGALFRIDNDSPYTKSIIKWENQTATVQTKFSRNVSLADPKNGKWYKEVSLNQDPVVTFQYSLDSKKPENEILLSMALFSNPSPIGQLGLKNFPLPLIQNGFSLVEPSDQSAFLNIKELGERGLRLGAPMFLKGYLWTDCKNWDSKVDCTPDVGLHTAFIMGITKDLVTVRNPALKNYDEPCFGSENPDSTLPACYVPMNSDRSIEHLERTETSVKLKLHRQTLVGLQTTLLNGKPTEKDYMSLRNLGIYSTVVSGVLNCSL